MKTAAAVVRHVFRSAVALAILCAGVGTPSTANAGEPVALPASTQTLDSIVPLRETVTPEYHVARTNKPPTLDAKLDDWAKVPAIALDRRSFVQGGDWNGLDDLNGSLKILWDDNGLYFALDVTDNVVVDAGKNQMLWQTDCTQLVFDSLLNGRDNPLSGTDSNYVVTRDATTTVLASYTNRPKTGGVFEERFPDVQNTIAFARRDGGYIYEWFLPWSRLPFVSPYVMGRCGFNFSLNDDDGTGYRGAMAWTRGLMYGFDPGRYGQIIFDGAVGTKDGLIPLSPGTGAEHQESERNRWLKVKDLRSLKSAGVVLQSTKDQKATATVKVYESDQPAVFATSQVEVELKTGKPTLVKWDLSTLPLGRYDVTYESSLVPAPAGASATRVNYEQLEEPVLPASSPPWVAGYRVRYAMQVLGDLHPQTAKTIVARLPTGGWLKEDASDILVQRADGSTGTVAVLSHDPKGDTIVQFRRNGMDRWYWVYASNPNATPADPAVSQKLADAKAAADAAMLAKMGLLKASADRAAALRDMNEQIVRESKTATDASTELAEWAKLLPDRQKAATDSAVLVPPAQDAVNKAAEANAPLQKVADEKTASARELTRIVDTTRQVIASAPELQDQANKTLETAKKLLADAQAARAAADAMTDQAAKVQAIAVADAKVATAQADVTAKTAVLADVTAKLADAQTTLATKEAATKMSEDEAQAARLAAAPSGTALTQAKETLAALTATSNNAAAQLKEATDRIAAATDLKNKSEAAIAQLKTQLPTVQTAAEQAKAAADNAGADSQAKADAYMTLAGDADPTIYKEGLVAEFHRWDGDVLSSWPAIVEGLQKSPSIQGNSLVSEILQNMNPFHREDARNFIARYRGNLKIDLPGIYSFYINGDDAAFIFIDGYKVYSRTGTNAPLQGRVPLYSIGSDIQLEAGVHPIEVYHVVGNSPNAIGLCGLMWLPPTPDAKRWQYITRANFVQPILSVPAQVEAFDGAPVAIPTFGIDDVLSADGITVYLTRFSADIAQDNLAASATVDGAARQQQLTWNFGDGTEAKGTSPSHLFFTGGDFDVTLKSHPQLPPFVRRVHMWTPPSPTNPASLGRAVEVLGAMEVAKLEPAKLDDAYYFLRICDQPTRWPVMEKVCRQILLRPNLDLKYRAMLHASLMRALAEQGRGEEALKNLNTALAEIGAIRTLKVQVQLAAAAVEQEVLKDYPAASKRYAQIINDNSRLRHSLVRQAAVAWGDMSAEAGDLTGAGNAYRLARSLGGPGSGAGGEADNDPVKRGALLRVAEQQLKEGNVNQTTRLLWRIEAEFPEQKIEGLYRFLRAEAERTAGRYDQAIRNYEALLNLRQWASYRPQAIQGTADSYYRMGDYPRALEWLTSLQKSYPDYFEERKLRPYRRAIEERLRNAAGEGAEVGGRPMPLFSSYTTGFELAEAFAPRLHAADPSAIRIRPSTGLDSPRTLFMDARAPQPQTVEVRLPTLRNFPTQGSLWVEVWYRDEAAVPTKYESRSISADVIDATGTKIATASTPLERSFGQWQKVGFKLQLPLTQDGEVTLTLRDLGAYVEFDAIRVEHISDGQSTALQRFIEGASPQ